MKIKTHVRGGPKARALDSELTLVRTPSFKTGCKTTGKKLPVVFFCPPNARVGVTAARFLRRRRSVVSANAFV